MYTTQGFMTAADLYDHQLLTDMHVHPDCPGHEDELGTAFCRAAADCSVTEARSYEVLEPVVPGRSA